MVTSFREERNLCLIVTAGILKIITTRIRKYTLMYKETRMNGWESKIKEMKNVKKGEQNKINTSVVTLDEDRLNSPMKNRNN